VARVAGRFLNALTGVFALATLASLACTAIPEGRSSVDGVKVIGNSAIEDEALQKAVATSPSPKFVGLFRGILYDYAVFDRETLQRDLARVERYYHARGYYDVRVRAGRVITTSERHVQVEIEVEEGPPVLNDHLKIEGLEGIPAEIAEEARKAATDKLPKGKPFDEREFLEAENALRRALTDRGYAYAVVERDALVDIVHHLANVRFAVVPGDPATFGKITFEGLGASDLPEKRLRRTLDIRRGAPYSTAVIASATQALLDLGVFSSVQILPELPSPPPSSHAVPLTVRVEPAKLRKLRLGGGVELDQIKTDLHLLLGWEHHNFLGGLRDFRVTFRPGLVLYPVRINNFVAPTKLLPEERLRGQLTQPGFLEARTNGFTAFEGNIFPLLVKAQPSPDDPVVGYRELKSTTGLERSLWKLFGSISYNAQIENPFTYQGPLDPALRTLFLSYPELLLQLDLRDDRVEPHRGLFLGADLQVAGLGGDARDVKLQPEIRTYLPFSGKLTFATRGSLGLLLAQNYGDIVQHHLGDPVTSQNRAERVRDVEIALFRGFFSGGPSSNRGFPIRGVSPHGVVPFLNPSTASQQVALSCEPSPDNNFSPDPNVCSVPIGGFSLWELSNELRYFASSVISLVGFCDMSDVSARQVDIRLRHLHLSCGLGARYMTPVGPIRLDLGYRIQPLQVLGFPNEDAVVRADPTEGVQPKLFGQPIAIAFGIGEAF
jgi:outer membrane protein assembly factor BamA